MDDALHYYRSGLEKNLAGQYEDAMTDYAKAIEVMPDYFDAYMKRGILGYRILKRYEESLADLEKAVALDPGSALAFLHLGVIKCHLLRFEEALPDLDRSIELDPNDERAFLNRGKNKYVLKYSKEEVCSDLERALRLGSAQAGEMLNLFYSPEQVSTRATMEAGMKKRARSLKSKR